MENPRTDREEVHPEVSAQDSQQKAVATKTASLKEAAKDTEEHAVMRDLTAPWEPCFRIEALIPPLSEGVEG